MPNDNKKDAVKEEKPLSPLEAALEIKAEEEAEAGANEAQAEEDEDEDDESRPNRPSAPRRDVAPPTEFVSNVTDTKGGRYFSRGKWRNAWGKKVD
jgi:hypothetical protein